VSGLAARMADFAPTHRGHIDVPEGLWDQLTTGTVSRGLTWDRPPALPTPQREWAEDPPG
jgi:hypothetical protein